MKLDLHLHTTASDGQYTPSELVSLAKGAELSVIAVTDHDTAAGVAEARLAAQREGIAFVPGIEISTMDTEEIHMLGLGINENDAFLLEKCAQFEQERQGRGKRVCEYLESKKIPVDWQEILEIAGEGSIGRPHFAEYLQRHGYVKERKEAFVKYLDTPEFHHATDRKLPAPEEAIAWIHHAGGRAVIAHPGLLKMGNAGQERLIVRLKEAGLDGIECIYSKHYREKVEKYIGWAKAYDLKISCGSDFHGEKVKPDVALGMHIDNPEWLEMLVEAVSYC